MTEQAKELSEKPHVVIATPGRLADHIESGTNFSLSKIQMLVSKAKYSIHTLSQIEICCILFN